MQYKVGIRTAALFGCALLAFGQNADSLPQFDVASLKPVPPPDGANAIAMIRARENVQDMMMPSGVPLKGMTVTLQFYSLRRLIALAYKIPVADVSGPDWMNDVRFDLEAKLPEGADTKTANLMLQRLLAERFALRTHRDTKSVPGYALVTAKDGARLPDAAPTDPTAAPPSPEEMQQRMKKMRQEMMQRQTAGGGPVSTWRSSSATPLQIATWISRMVHAPVADETGLTGKYDVSIEVAAGDSADDSLEYRVAAAIAKYGLKLESRKVTTDRVVVDSASKVPTEN